MAVEPRGGSVDVRWAPAPESDVTHYVVAYALPNDPHHTTVTVTEPHATLERLEAGSIVAVKAVNDRGMMGWDWAMVDVRE